MGPAPTINPLPQLMPNGANWVSYKRRVIISLSLKPMLLEHLEGLEPQPTHPAPLASGSKAMKDELDAQAKLMLEFKHNMAEWWMHDYAVQKQIISSLPDSIFICVQNSDTTAEMWDALKSDFEGWTQAVQNELRNWLTLAKCGDNENIQEHIDRMHYMFEELSGIGIMVTSVKYVALLIKSMLKSYGHHFAAISGAAKVSENSLTPNMVMNHAVVFPLDTDPTWILGERDDDRYRWNGTRVT
jgi:hypothetical protein